MPCLQRLASTGPSAIPATASYSELHLCYSVFKDFCAWWKGAPPPSLCECRCDSGGCGALERLLEKQLAVVPPVHFSVEFYFSASTALLILGFVLGYWCARRTVTVGHPVPALASPAFAELVDQPPAGAAAPSTPIAGRGRGRGIIIHG